MFKCEFCEKYQPDSDGKFKCEAMFPTDYCKAALNRMTTVMVATLPKVEEPKPKVTTCSTEEFATIVGKFFGGR